MIVDGIVVVVLLDETPENQNHLDCTHCDISVFVSVLYSLRAGSCYSLD